VTQKESSISLSFWVYYLALYNTKRISMSNYPSLDWILKSTTTKFFRLRVELLKPSLKLSTKNWF